MIITTVLGKPVWKKTDGDYYIYIEIISGPFIITEYGNWIVGSDNGALIRNERVGLTTPPRSGWVYYDGTDWVLDGTLLFLPGGPWKEL